MYGVRPYVEMCISKKLGLAESWGMGKGSSHIGWIAGTYTVKVIFTMTGDPLGNAERLSNNSSQTRTPNMTKHHNPWVENLSK